MSAHRSNPQVFLVKAINHSYTLEFPPPAAMSHTQPHGHRNSGFLTSQPQGRPKPGFHHSASPQISQPLVTLRLDTTSAAFLAPLLNFVLFSLCCCLLVCSHGA